MVTLKEVFLLQEREDLLFVASELIKHYGLKSKVNLVHFVMMRVDIIGILILLI